MNPRTEQLEQAIRVLLEIFNAAYANFVGLAGLPVVTKEGRAAIESILVKHNDVLQGFRIEWLDLNIYKILQNLSALGADTAQPRAVTALTDLIGALIERYRFFLGRGVKLLFDKETRAQIIANTEFLQSIGAWERLPDEIRHLTDGEVTESAQGIPITDITLRSGHDEITFRPGGALLGILAPRDVPAVSNLVEAVRAALEQPLGAKRLTELAAGVSSVTIIVDDHTRPTPTARILPEVLAELFRARVPESAITILVATGMHRPPTAEELARIVPPEIAAHIRVVIHDCKDENALVEIGRARSGVPLKINRAVAEADLVLAIGMIAPHPYAGFTGGAKSVSPGVASLETIVANHILNVFPSAGPGQVAGNPVQEDIAHAGRAGKLAFVVNTVMNGASQVVDVLAGDPFKVTEVGFERAREIYRAPYPAKSDVVIVSCGGHPRDANLYLAVRAVKTAQLVIRRGGYIVLVAGCAEEMGPARFAQVMRDMPTMFEETLHQEPEQVIAAHVLKTTKTIVVSCVRPGVFEELGLRHAVTVEDALQQVTHELGREPTVLVITNGWTVIPDRVQGGRVQKSDS
ncbi:MAG: nickel-dependent lactate racemase [Anaerolineae bacterium]|nr:nickel-dependent lactate racemase [Anaerolineae bacterium]